MRIRLVEKIPLIIFLSIDLKSKYIIEQRKKLNPITLENLTRIKLSTKIER